MCFNPSILDMHLTWKGVIIFLTSSDAFQQFTVGMGLLEDLLVELEGSVVYFAKLLIVFLL